MASGRWWQRRRFRDTRPVGIRYSLTGPRRLRCRRSHRRYRYRRHRRGTVGTRSGGSGVCRSVGRSVGFCLPPSVGRSREPHQLCTRGAPPFSITRCHAHRVRVPWPHGHVERSADDAALLMMTAAATANTTTNGGRGDDYGDDDRCAHAAWLSPPPPHLSLLRRAREEEAPHSRVVARTRPTHPACPPVGHLGAWTVFRVFLFIYFF